MRAAAIGLIVGVLLFALDRAFSLRQRIVDSRLLPPFLDTLLPTMCLPMALGAAVVALDSALRARRARGGDAAQRAIHGRGLLVGAVVAVGWWALPLLLFGLIAPILIASVGYAIAWPIQRAVSVVWDEAEFLGLHIGAAIVGGAFVAGISVLSVAVVCAAIGKRPWEGRALGISGTVGAVLGIIYGVLWTASWIADPGTWPISSPR